MWNLEAGKETLTLRGHTMGILSLALTGDSKRLVSGSHDKSIKVWDLGAGKEKSAMLQLADPESTDDVRHRPHRLQKKSLGVP
jgi:WD40 repeat protein